MKPSRSFLFLTLSIATVFVVSVASIGFMDNSQKYHLSTMRTLLDDEPAGQSCTTDAECGGTEHGTCALTTNAANVTEGTCVCKPEWADKDCSYERKHKLTAFLLSFLLGGWGADRFYLGFAGVGVAKLLLTLINCYGGIALQVGKNALGEKLGDKKTIALGVICVIYCCTSLGATAWWLTDWILILKDELPDYNGYAVWDNM